MQQDFFFKKSKMTTKDIIKKIIPFFGDKFFNRFYYTYNHLRLGVKKPKLEFEDPRRFNHKIIWLKMNYRHKKATLFADKLLVKDYIADIISPDIIIPTLQEWISVSDIDKKTLPDSFVLKCNHGSGWIVLVDNKNDVDWRLVKKNLSNWLKTNYYKVGREYQYGRIVPKIFAEPYIRTEDGESLPDYKIFCFNGEPKFIQVDVGRFTNHKRNFYDLNWKQIPFQLMYPGFSFDIPKPERLDYMIDIAKKLSKNIPFLRVDLYAFGKTVYFGELTFHPEGGFGPITPDVWDKKLGKLISLPYPKN